MEINTTYPSQNTLASQALSRDQKVVGIEESSERAKANNSQAQAERAEPGSGDTVNLSPESLKLAQAAGQSNDNQGGISSPEQAQAVLGKLISDIQNNSAQALHAYAGSPRVNLGAL